MITKDDKKFILDEYLYDLDLEISSTIKQIENSNVDTQDEKMERQTMYDVLKRKLDRQSIVNRWIKELK